MTFIKLSSLPENELQNKLNQLDNSKTKTVSTPFIFDIPFLTKTDKGHRSVVQFPLSKKTTLSRVFDLFNKAKYDFDTDPSDFKNTISLFNEFGKTYSKKDFSDSVLERRTAFVGLDIPLFINETLTVSGWLTLHIFAEDTECLQINACWQEHNHIKGNTLLWFFEDCGEELISKLSSLPILDLELPYCNEELFIDCESTTINESIFADLLKDKGMCLSE